MKISIKDYGDRVLFEHDEENNTLKNTLEVAVRNKIDLSGAKLEWAELKGAKPVMKIGLSQSSPLSILDPLEWAKLDGAKLKGAKLDETNFQGANLSGADLSGANLFGADLSWVDLSRADLRGANLSEADLRETVFRMADLSGAILSGAILDNTIFYGAKLEGARLDVKTPPLVDHTFISEILLRNATTKDQKDFALYIKKESGFTLSFMACWIYFYELAKEKNLVDWATETLSRWKEYQERIQEIIKKKKEE